MPNWLRLLFAFVLLSFFYAFWMTGATFRFAECKGWPNHNMPARAYAKGQIHLDETGSEDYALVNGKAYMVTGPVPALLRLPVLLLLNREVPTGLMVVLFCAGVNVLFIMTLPLIGEPDSTSFKSPIAALFVVVMIFNGVSLFMVSVPSFHHETRASGMFFLMAAVYLFFRTRESGYSPSHWTAVLLGTALASALGTRLSYGPAAAFLGMVLTGGAIRTWRSEHKTGPLKSLAIVGAITGTALILLLLHNYVRYGSCFDTGMNHLVSNLFGEYHREYGSLRYEHIPFNLWSFFFKMPILVMDFPFIALPAYTVNVDSVQFSPYHLLYRNELSVSVFVLMPILTCMSVPVLFRLYGSPEQIPTGYWILFGLFALQVAVVSLVPITTLRYYYDFVPFAALMGYLGAVRLARRLRGATVLIGCLAAVTLVLGLAGPIYGVLFYGAVNVQAIRPLQGLLFRILP
ncbi:MAG: hypothetical protein V1792_14075 [Pseudomonadota bacterium]